MGSWADYAIVIVCAASAVFGLWRGFVKEAFSLVTWLVAILCAWKFSWVVEPMLGEWIAQPGLKLWTARVAVLVLVLIAGGLVGWLVRAIVHTTGLGGVDRILGGAFGFVRGVVIVGLAVIGLQLSGLDQDPWWQEARLRPLSSRVADAIRYYGSLGGEYLREQELLPSGAGGDSARTRDHRVADTVQSEA
ncbi:MAG: CvpA family protein [Gammaproteobacteria bacterium]|nr:colicin V production CvpA [Gammaproteobacteria bacterium]